MQVPPSQMAKMEAAARQLLAAGFTTKAAQKDAKECAARAYEYARNLVQSVAQAIPREQRTAAQEDIYFDLPYGAHQWRAKHAEMVCVHLPAAAAHLTAIERMVALYQEIAAAPVNLKPRNADGTLVRIPHRSEAYNPELRAEFMKQAPALAASYAAHVRSIYAHYLAEFGGKVPCDLYPGVHKLTEKQKDKQSMVTNLIGRHSKIVGLDSVRTARHYVLDEATVDKKAAEYGEAVALQWFFKTNLKLGELAGATLHEDSGGYVVVSGRKGDTKIVLRQQRVTKWAPKAREIYSQFPARLYVDGKFTPEAVYAKRFDIAEVEA